MKNFIVYNSTGKILRTGSCPDNMVVAQTPDYDEWVIEGEADDLAQYVDINTLQIVNKPPIVPIANKYEIVANGIDETSIYNLPVPCRCKIECAELKIFENIEITDGSLEFTATHAGMFKITLTADFYLDTEVTINAV